MIALTQSREEFSARRRKAQTDLEAALRPAVVRALDLSENTDGWAEVLDVVERLYRAEYATEAGQPASAMPRSFLTDIHDALKQTNRSDQPDPASVDRITIWLATIILSFATMQAALDDTDDVFVEWVTMHDNAVRHAHKVTDGQVRPVGEMFDVDGVEMPYPGWVGAPIELWINCRCTLRPTTPAAAMAGGWGAPSETEYEMPKMRDVPADERDRLVKEGKALPDGSFPIANCEDLNNAIRAIGRAKDPAKAKAHIKKRAADLNCGDVIPEDWGLHSVKAATLPRVTQEEVDAAESPMMKGFLSNIKAQQDEAESPNQETKNKSTVIVALPAEDDAVHQIGEEQKHVTLCFLGEFDGDIDAVHAAVQRVASEMEPMVSSVGGNAVLGPDKAKVLILDDPDLITARNKLRDEPTILAAHEAADTHPNTIMHMTLTYDDALPSEAENLSEIALDRLAVWHRDEQTEYALGGDMPDDETPDAPEVEAPDPTDEAPPLPSSAEMMEMEAAPVPWHGPLAPEGVRSGDGRRFTAGSLTNRPLPLPLTWQKVSDDGHKRNVTVAKIERVVKKDGLFWGSGHMIMNPEADEFTGLLAEFGRYGVSVDADEAEFDLNEEDDCVDFTHARVSSACGVSIPAFAEAWVALGDWPEEIEAAWQAQGSEATTDDAEPTDLAAALVAMAGRAAQFKDLAPGKTEDGPGWLTHPVDTDRLRDYWVRGPGAAKIGWGTPGDFNRCRAQVAKYVKPQYLAGYCANRHYDALGFWPGRPVAGDTVAFAEEKERIENLDAHRALSLVASGVLTAPAEWFRDPQFSIEDEWMVQDREGNWACPLTITEDGHVFGHLAKWNSCHMDSAGLGEVCVKPPKSTTDYAYFLHGAVHLDDGTKAAVGPLTFGGGHAAGRLGMRAALAHYDDASTVWADVAVGEDEFGIWFNGWVRPGTSDEIVTAAAASPLSGDWRQDPHGNLELIIGHCVNSPGYLIPRVSVAASVDGQISLVAAGVVEPSTDAMDRLEASGIDTERLGQIIEAHLVVIEDNRKRMAALRKHKMRSLAARMKETV